jgi:hypothetical protein
VVVSAPAPRVVVRAPEPVIHVEPPTVRFTAPPPLVAVAPSVQVVEDADDEVFFSAGWYWHCGADGSWWRTRDYRGGWVAAPRRVVPVAIVRMPRGHYRHYHAEMRHERNEMRHERHEERREMRQEMKREEKAERKRDKHRG